MEDEEAKKIHGVAKHCAKKYGFSKDDEDLAQDVIVQFLENGKTGQTTAQGVVTAIRKRYGRAGGRNKSLRDSFNQPHELLDNTASVAASQDMSHPIHEALQYLDGNQRVVICLFFLWGLLEREVGYCLGVTESRANQIKKEALEKLKLSLKESS